MPAIRNVIFKHINNKSCKILKKERSLWIEVVEEGASYGKYGKIKVLDHHMSLLKKVWIPFQSVWRPSLWSRTTSKFSGLPSGNLRDSRGPL